MKKFYFSRFEDRRPYQPVEDTWLRTLIFKISGSLTLLTGIAYMIWRWTSTINHEHPVFSYTLVFAETFSFIGICLYVFDMWHPKDYEKQRAPEMLSEIEPLEGRSDRALKVDVFIATLNEEAELLRYTIRDTKEMRVPNGVIVKIYLLDDGRRDGRDPQKENVKEVCMQEGVSYVTRETNSGYKAGNLKNGLAHSDGDIFVILDADSRPFPGFLENTLGYFRKQNVGWVQTCHWFYDTTEALPLSEYIIRSTRIQSRFMQKLIRIIPSKIKTGEDIFGSDPRQFYQVLLRRRNYHNASFCCGAGSIHRREAVHGTALKIFSKTLKTTIGEVGKKYKLLDSEQLKKLSGKVLKEVEYTPFMYHASEDLYTSMVIHSDRDNKWESVLHPFAECKLLSPQDVGSFVKQRCRYAEGSIDIAIHDNPLFKSGLTWRQKVCYFHTAWSYFSCLWIFVFLLSPIFYFLSHVVPVSCDTADFLKFFLPFMLFNQVSDKTGSWGISQKRGKQYYICLFWFNLVSIIKVFSGKKVKFNCTPKSKQKSEQPLRYAWPHLALTTLTLGGICKDSIAIYFHQLEFSLAYSVNVVWGLLNCYALNVFVRAAYWNIESDPVDEEKSADQMAEKELIIQ